QTRASVRWGEMTGTTQQLDPGAAQRRFQSCDTDVVLGDLPGAPATPHDDLRLDYQYHRLSGEPCRPYEIGGYLTAAYRPRAASASRSRAASAASIRL